MVPKGEDSYFLEFAGLTELSLLMPTSFKKAGEQLTQFLWSNSECPSKVAKVTSKLLIWSLFNLSRSTFWYENHWSPPCKSRRLGLYRSHCSPLADAPRSPESLSSGDKSAAHNVIHTVNDTRTHRKGWLRVLLFRTEASIKHGLGWRMHHRCVWTWHPSWSIRSLSLSHVTTSSAMHDVLSLLHSE